MFGHPNPNGLIQHVAKHWGAEVWRVYPDVKVEIFIDYWLHVEANGRYGRNNFADLGGRITIGPIYSSQGGNTAPLIYTEALSSQHCPVRRKSDSAGIEIVGHTSPKIKILISFFDHSSERIRDTEPPILSLCLLSPH